MKLRFVVKVYTFANCLMMYSDTIMQGMETDFAK